MSEPTPTLPATKPTEQAPPTRTALDELSQALLDSAWRRAEELVAMAERSGQTIKQDAVAKVRRLSPVLAALPESAAVVFHSPPGDGPPREWSLRPAPKPKE